MKNSYSQMSQNFQERISDMELMASDQRFKFESMSKQLSVLENMIKYEQVNAKKQNQDTSVSSNIDQNISSIKELVYMDRQKCDSQYEDVNKMFVGLQSLVHSIKGDLVKKMKEHRDEYLGIFN
jgi:hypothetical protein